MNPMSLVLVSLVFILFLVYQFWWKNKRFYELYAKIPNSSTFLETLKIMHGFVGADNKKCMKILLEATKPGPSSPRKYWHGPYPSIIVDDPDQLRKLLSSKNCIDRPAHLYDAFRMDQGLLSLNGDAWRKHRKLLEPSFHANILKSFQPIFNGNNQILMQVLAKRPEGQEFDLVETLEALALDNLLKTSTGIDKRVQTEENNEVLHHFAEGAKIFGVKMVNFWLRLKIIMRMTKWHELERKHILNGQFKVADDVIEHKERDVQEVDTTKPQIFIDQLFKMRDEFSREEMRDEINTVILGGFDTIATTLSMMVLLLAMHPRVQEKIHEELNRVYDTADEEVTQEKLDQLSYLEMVIKESMRIWPTVPFLGRRVNDDMQLGDYLVPGGVVALVPIYAVHHNKAIWGADADEFRPERFEPAEFSKISPFVFLGFSRGPRNCIGYKYAMDSMKITLSYIFRKYKVSTSTKMEDVEFDFSVLMKLHKGSRISLQSR